MPAQESLTDTTEVDEVMDTLEPNTAELPVDGMETQVDTAHF